MAAEVLYLGDTSLAGAASYLAGVMSHFKIGFDYRPSHEKFDSSFFENDYKLVIISDYRSANFSAEQLQKLCDKVKQGMGLLMIGGWESYTGLEGGYNETILKDVLPVEMQEEDDRVNTSAVCLVHMDQPHPVVNNLPFEQQSPVIGGFNLVNVKEAPETILSVQMFGVSGNGDGFSFVQAAKCPLLVVGTYGRANVTCLTTDVAPHWVGGFVDWGPTRIKAQAAGAESIEVGCYYAEFFANIVRWTGQL